MENNMVRQHDAAKPLSGRYFLLGIAGVVVRMAIAQIVVNFLITVTGLGLINLAFYVFCVWLIISFMRKTVASYVYTLEGGVLTLERRLGDSPISVIQIPVSRIVSLRPVKMGERLRTSYRQVTVIDPSCAPVLRVRAAYVLSLFSARLARRCAGKFAMKDAGVVVVFDEDNQRRVCVFRPNAEMLSALAGVLGDRFGFDERMTRGKITTLYGRALERAFPELYPYVEPLTSEEDVQRAAEEVRRQNEARAQLKEKRARAAGKGKKKEESEKDKAADATQRRRKQQ